MKKDPQEIKFYSNELDKELTIREYFIKLLITLWEQEEGFSGKRPFGNSGWQFEIYEVLIKEGFIDGSLDEDGYVDALNHAKADKFIVEEIIEKL